MRKVIVVLVLLSLVFSAVPALAQDEEPTTVYLRVGHFVPGTGEVDVYVNGALSDIQGLAFGDLTEWLQVNPGFYNLAVVPSGQTLDQAVMEAEAVELAAGSWITVAAIGEVERGTAALYPIEEDYSPITFGETRVTFLHAIPDLGPVNVQLGDGMVLVTGLAYPELESDDEDASTGLYTLDILDGLRTLQVTPYNDAETILMELEGVQLANGKHNLIVATGLQANAIAVMEATDPEDVLSLNATPDVVVGDGTVEVRLAHFAPGAGEVDIYINGEKTHASVDFGNVTDWNEFEAGLYDLAIVPLGGELEDAVIVADDLPLITDQWMTLAVIGSVELESGLIYPIVEDHSSINDGETRLAFFHAVPDLGAVNVQLADGTLLIGAATYPSLEDSTPYAALDLIAGPRDLQITALDSETVLFDLAGTQLPVGTNTLLVAAGLASNAVTFQIVTDAE
jgi:hypothetical protein